MCSLIKRICGIFFLLLFLCIHKSWGLPKHPNAITFNRKHLQLQLQIGIGVGVPYGVIFKDKEGFYIANKAVNIAMDPHVDMHILIGYELPISNNKKIGLAGGLNYGSTRKVKIAEFNIRIEERNLFVPVGILWTSINDNLFYCEKKILFGYEFNFILSSYYKQSGYVVDLDPSFYGDKNLKRDFPNITTPLGNILISQYLQFLKGFYLGFVARIPIDLFSIKKDAIDEGRLNENFVKLLRVFNTNLVEVELGVNIMRLIYPPLDYPAKKNRHKKSKIIETN